MLYLLSDLKPSNDRGEFGLDRARSKNNIAENAFALGHETDSTRAIRARAIEV